MRVASRFCFRIKDDEETAMFKPFLGVGLDVGWGEMVAAARAPRYNASAWHSCQRRRRHECIQIFFERKNVGASRRLAPTASNLNDVRGGVATAAGAVGIIQSSVKTCRRHVSTPVILQSRCHSPPPGINRQLLHSLLDLIRQHILGKTPFPVVLRGAGQVHAAFGAEAEYIL